MRHVKWIFVVLLASSLTSFIEKGKSTGGLNVGDVAPDFKIEPTSKQTKSAKFALSDLKGKYVLLSFWASYDTQSRMQNIQLSNVLKSANPSHVELVSISFDEYPSIFKETIKMDEIETPNCFIEHKGEESTLYKRYKLNRGFKNYLLDENGVILAKNISAIELPNYLRAAS
ncbi:MAG: peroxiredoxin family protein [Bacteroides sp.]